MNPIICFIDDSGFEHDLVRNEIAPLAPNQTFVQAYTFEEARNELGRRTPAIFLLDLWGQDDEVSDPFFFRKKSLGEKSTLFPTWMMCIGDLMILKGTLSMNI